MTEVKAVDFKNGKIQLLDQRKLPQKEVWLAINKLSQLEKAIKSLAVRGAPALGVTAALGLKLTLLNSKAATPKKLLSELEKAALRLKKTRPTAVNLFWAIDRIINNAKKAKDQIAEIKKAVLSTTQAILEEEEEFCRKISQWGETLIPPHARILTHCNTGSLATGGSGTALGVIKQAHKSGKQPSVWVDETRPLLQGARLTAWELCRANIPYRLISDNMAAFLMQQKKVDLVIVGADRIARNGDTANKIGTYSLAVLANFHKIPFYIAAPSSTIDLKLKSGKKIPIEERNPDELLKFAGKFCAPPESRVYNPAFDLTPAKLITAIITEKGIFRAPFFNKG